MIKHEILNPKNVLNTFIVTAVHDKYIERCLKTLNETINREEHRIIFLECPSYEPRNTLYDIIKPYVDIYVRTEKNYGFSKTVNLGLAWVFTPYFTVVHDDCWFIHKGWWNKVKEDLDKRKDTLMLQPVQRYRREEVELSEFPTEEEYQKLLKEARNSSVAEIYCMIFKREWLDLIGLFDESIYPIGPEDLEFYRLARSIDKRIGVSSRAVIYHKGAGRNDKLGGAKNDGYHNDYQTVSFNEKWDGNPKQAVGGLTTGDNRKPNFPNYIRQL